MGITRAISRLAAVLEADLRYRVEARAAEDRFQSDFLLQQKAQADLMRQQIEGARANTAAVNAYNEEIRKFHDEQREHMRTCARRYEAMTAGIDAPDKPLLH